MFAYKLKTFFMAFAALAVSCAFCLCLQLANTCKLSAIDGERTFYLRNASAQALRTQNMSLQDTFYVKGESVRLILRGDGEEFAARILQTFRAETLFKEEVCGVVSYYCYAPALGKGVCVNGKNVNLHIAVGEGRAAVGTPMIFDGF